jgi:ferric-dicitrate binding protein FerR (iron transport regulator)
MIDDPKKDSIHRIHVKIKNGMHTVSISPGWRYKMFLPDGSKVILNTSSSVTYNLNAFAVKKRSVNMEGEVYFEVAKNANKPFYVTAKGAKLEVLGTSFTVNTYSNRDSVYTTLINGSLRAITGNSSVLLQPGQRAAMANGTPNRKRKKRITTDSSASTIKIDTVNISREKSWTEGYFSFFETSVHAAVQELGRWYNWDVRFKDSAKAGSITATFCRGLPEAETLELLKSKGVNFTKTGKRIIITQ